MSGIEADSSTWSTVKGWAEKQIAETHLRLEVTGQTPAETEFLRGQIAACRGLLALARPRPPLREPPPAY